MAQSHEDRVKKGMEALGIGNKDVKQMTEAEKRKALFAKLNMK